MYAKGLEGDMRAALDTLKRIPDVALSDNERRQRDCIERSFADSAPPPIHVADPLVANAISAYRAYWRLAMLGKLDKAAAETFLANRLRSVLPAPPDAGAAGSLDDLADALGAALSERGYHSIHGTTLPYRDLMVWRTETSKRYDVTLPDAPRSVEVVLLRDFQSLGWSAFATCDEAYTGGWAEHDRLYCVADSYDLGSEHFLVSYLAHETEHFADYERFPKLEQPELEYRAKLVELIESRQTTRQLVARFAEETSERASREAPHSFANGRVTRDLRRTLRIADQAATWWTTTPEEAIRGAARTLFESNTRELVARGAKDVARVL